MFLLKFSFKKRNVQKKVKTNMEVFKSLTFKYFIDDCKAINSCRRDVNKLDAFKLFMFGPKNPLCL